MQRLRKDEHGAVAIVIALLMVVLIGFAALAVDVSSMWAEKRQLQNGADAAALAVAQKCAKTPASCSNAMALSTAKDYVGLNRTVGASETKIESLTTSSVTVRAFDLHHKNLFAPVIDAAGESEVGARATAKWGGPKKVATEMPLTFSACTWSKYPPDPTGGTEVKIDFYEPGGSPCFGYPPGGFAWIDPDSGKCGRVSKIGDSLPSDTGKSEPKECSETYLKSLLNKEVLLPIFDSVTGTGSGAKYHIMGYAAFKMTAFKFVKACHPGKCTGSDEWIKGYFLRYVDLNDPLVLELGGPDLGANIISLTK